MANFEYATKTQSARDVLKDLDRFDQLAGYVKIYDGGEDEKLHSAMNELYARGWRLVAGESNLIYMFKQPR